MKKILGYGYKMSSESLSYALFHHYDINCLEKTKKEVFKGIKEAKTAGLIPKTAKIKLFKVVVEVLE